MIKKIGFLGIGLMGLPMAKNILKAGYILKAYNRSQNKAAALKDIGADFHKQASLTHRFAAHHGMKIGTDGVQLLGGHGFTHEPPVESWYRNLRAIGIFEAGAGV